MLLAAIEGFALGAGLIIAIGAQNAFVIRQGIIGRHVFPVATICFLSDALLIAVGAAGVGALIAANDVVRSVAAWGGAAFLLVYGLKALHAAWRAEGMDWNGEGGRSSGLKPAILTALAFTYLNPHVYIDTVMLVGGVAGQFDARDRYAFTGGAILASCVWFYGLAYGATRLAPLFRTATAARVLDGTIALIMFSVAGALIWGEVGRWR